MELIILLLLGFSSSFSSQWSQEARYNAAIPDDPDLIEKGLKRHREKLKMGLDHEFGPN